MADYQDKAAFLKAVSYSAKKGKKEGSSVSFKEDESARDKKYQEDLKRRQADASDKTERLKRATLNFYNKQELSDDLDLEDEVGSGAVRDELGANYATALKNARAKLAEKRKGSSSSQPQESSKVSDKEHEDNKEKLRQMMRNRLLGR